MGQVANLPDKRNIVKEYLDFVSSMRYANQNALGIKKALLFGINTIVNTSYKDQEVYLIQHYTKELSETKDWLEGKFFFLFFSGFFYFGFFGFFFSY